MIIHLIIGLFLEKFMLSIKTARALNHSKMLDDCSRNNSNKILRYIFYITTEFFQASAFTCRAFTFSKEENRCYLSGDDSISLSNAPLTIRPHAVYAEKQCSISKYFIYLVCIWFIRTFIKRIHFFF